MKKEREILWTKPIPKRLRFEEKDLITLTKEEEKKLFAGKLNPKDIIERANKEKQPKSKIVAKRSVARGLKPKRTALITKGKK